MFLLKKRPKGIPVIVVAVLSTMSVGVSAQTRAIQDPIHNPSKFPPELVQEIENARNSIRTNGYIDKSSSQARSEYVKDRMRERIAFAEVKGNSSLEELGFVNIETGLDLLSERLGLEPVLPESDKLGDFSEGYVLLGGNRTKLFYEGTQLFGDLLIDEVPGATSQLEEPNVRVAGRDAVLRYVKYSDDRWGTVLHSPSGTENFIIMEASRLLEGDDLARFLELADGIVNRF